MCSGDHLAKPVFWLLVSMEVAVKLMKRFALVMFVLAMSIPASPALAHDNGAFQGRGDSQGRGNSGNGNGTSENGNPIHSVPEPTTLALMGAAAAALGVRKVWERRRR